VLGILNKSPAQARQSGLYGPEGQPVAVDGADDATIEAKIAARAEAKQNKDFATADQIRDELQAMGVVLEDKAGKTSWRRG
jgi:cysteinyl-tRNA synthetase